MANTFDWVEIRTRDVVKAAGFFGKLFGWEVIRRLDAEGCDYWIFDTGGDPRPKNLRRGALWLSPCNEGPRVVVYVHVEEIDATLTNAVALGRRVVAPKRPEARAFKACFADPDGNVFGLWQEPKDDST
jgi:predicted enzyme related to lactoylglutathione lyase